MPRTIFLSWAGEPSGMVARALRSWLPCSSGDLRPWMSSDLTLVQRWTAELASHLDATDTGILCVNAENQNSPWLNFEASVLSRSVERARVIPYVVGMSSAGIPGPMGPSASSRPSRPPRDGTMRLVEALLPASAGAAAFDHKMFEAFWPALDGVIATASSGESTAEPALKEIETL